MLGIVSRLLSGLARRARSDLDRPGVWVAEGFLATGHGAWQAEKGEQAPVSESGYH